MNRIPGIKISWMNDRTVGWKSRSWGWMVDIIDWLNHHCRNRIRLIGFRSLRLDDRDGYSKKEDTWRSDDT
jgi:hypothetical protein